MVKIGNIILVCGTLFVIALTLVACIPLYWNTQLIEAECDYSSSIEEIMINQDTYFNGKFEISYRFYHRPENETAILFIRWYTGEVYYDTDSKPVFTQYSINYIEIENWINKQDHFYTRQGFKCFVNPENTQYFKICDDYDECYYQNFIWIILPMYITFMVLLVVLLCGFCITFTHDPNCSH